MIVMTPRTQPLATSSLSRRAALAGGAGLLGLGLAACSGASSSEEGDGDTITIGRMPSRADPTGRAFLLKNHRAQPGNTVASEWSTDAAIAYTALSEGDIDLYSSAWPDVTHAAYMDEYGDNFEDIVTYNNSATNMLVVPEYTDISTIEELAADPERFGSRIVGIERSEERRVGAASAEC